MKKIYRSDTTYGETKPRSISKDRKLLSKQKHEIKVVATKYGITQKYVREIQCEVGVSRRAVEAELKLRKIPPKKNPNNFKRLKK